MASTVRIIRPGRPSPQAHPKVELVSSAGGRLVLPYAPKLTRDGLARVWSTADRIGRKPKLADTAKGLETQTFDLYLAHPDYERSIEGLVSRLERFADSGHRVRWRNFGREGGWWVVSALSIEDELRQEGSNLLTRATASLTLTEAGKGTKGRGEGPVTGGHLGSGGSSGGTLAGEPTDTGGLYRVASSESLDFPRSYVTGAQDSLAQVAYRFYGDPDAWAQIADANSIRDVRDLASGRLLTIPEPA